MVALHVYLEPEGGARLTLCRDAVGAAKYVCSRSEGSTCLRFIDPYGDTVFNRGQCAVLMVEWSVLTENAPPDLRPWMLDVAELVERCATDVHLYVRFEGD